MLISFFNTRSINRSILLLQKKTKDIAKGKFEKILDIASPPEIKDLANELSSDYKLIGEGLVKVSDKEMDKQEKIDLLKNIKDIEEKAIEKIRLEQPDLVLMDIKMPVLDGIDATKQIKEVKPALPIIAQTAFVLKNERDLCIDAGCDEYIPKPIKTHVLLEMIDKFFANGN